MEQNINGGGNMPYRSMQKTNQDKMKDIDDANPENNQTQSILSPAFNNSAVNKKKQRNHTK